jgi:hypothetical protein
MHSTHTCFTPHPHEAIPLPLDVVRKEFHCRFGLGDAAQLSDRQLGRRLWMVLHSCSVRPSTAWVLRGSVLRGYCVGKWVRGAWLRTPVLFNCSASCACQVGHNHECPLGTQRGLGQCDRALLAGVERPQRLRPPAPLRGSSAGTCLPGAPTDARGLYAQARFQCFVECVPCTICLTRTCSATDVPSASTHRCSFGASAGFAIVSLTCIPCGIQRPSQQTLKRHVNPTGRRAVTDQAAEPM